MREHAGNRLAARLRDGVARAARRATRWARPLIAASTLLISPSSFDAVSLFAQDQPAEPPTQPETPPVEEKLLKLTEMQLPSFQDLLIGTPLDWIVLKTTEVIVCESVVPRPDTLNLRQQEIKALNDSRAGKSKAELEEINEKLIELGDLVITVPGDMENPEYRLDLRRIDRIIHHEDLILQRIDQLARDGELEAGFELLSRLERDWPAWPGLKERHDNLLFADSSARLAAGNPESALVTLTELQQRAANYPGLADLMGQGVDQIVSGALSANDYRQARYFLLRLDKVFPGHAIFQKHAGEMAAQTERLLSEGDQARRDGRHPVAAELARQAAELWPRTPNLLPRIKPLLDRYQRLHVGVVDLSSDVSPSPSATAAQVRAERLMHSPLFELERVKGGNVYYRARYFEEWEPYDLGRVLRITLRQLRQPWEAQALIDAPSLAALIEQRLDPAGKEYDERLASCIASIQVESPVALTLRFRRVPPRVEPLLDDLIPAPLPLEPDDASRVVAGGFVPADVQADRIVFRRALSEPDGLPQYHVAEVVEQRYASHEKALQALREGEVSVLPDLPDWIVRRVQAETDFQKEFFIQKYSVPVTHVIQFNPRSPGVRVRELRRALAYAIDRDKLLRETVLRDPRAEHGRVTNGPFPSSSPANSVDIEPHEYDLTSALAMVLAAGRQMDNRVPALKMIVPRGPVEQAVGASLVRTWKRIGLDVQIIDQPPADGAPPVDWDLHYRTLQMLEPTVELWPFLAAADRAQISDLSAFPDWLKQQLVSVDRTSDWALALDATRRLHEVLSADVRFIPLWEVDGYLVVRKNIQGFPESPLHSYQHIDNWTVNAWYRSE